MTLPNHIIGGIVFTGFVCSIYDINIFANSYLLMLIIAGAILPDIDSPRSIVGKAFYPISIWIYKRYGHRTITHSLVFMLLTFAVCGGFEFAFSQQVYYSKIFTLAILSHNLCDVVTVAGVPLLYPFTRRVCVMPGNRAARLLTGNITHELIAFSFFVLLGLLLYPLFTNGFWMTFNNKLGGYKQVENQYYKDNHLIEVEFEFENGWYKYQGTGYVIEISPFIILKKTAQKPFVFLEVKDKKSGSFFMQKTSKIKRLKLQNFTLNSDTILRQLYHVEVRGDQSINFIADGKLTVAPAFKGEFINELRIAIPVDGAKNYRLKKLERMLLNLIKRKNLQEKSNLQIEANINQLEEEFRKSTNYTQHRLKNEIDELSGQLSHVDYSIQIENIQLELELLKEELDIHYSFEVNVSKIEL